MQRRSKGIAAGGILCSRRTATLMFGASLMALPAASALAADSLTKQVIARSQVSTGNTARLAKVFAKARRGEPITLGVIGGSITGGGIPRDTPKN